MQKRVLWWLDLYSVEARTNNRLGRVGRTVGAARLTRGNRYARGLASVPTLTKKRGIVWARSLIVLVSTVVASQGLSAKAGDLNLLSLSSDTLLVDTLYRNPKRMVSGVAPDGAIGVNAQWEQDPSRQWFIEEQRYGADLIQMGVATNRSPSIDEGVRILNWGFEHEADGNFPGTGDPHHSISFFLEAASRSVLLLREAGDDRHLAELRHWNSNIRKAARNLITPGVFPRDRSKSMDPYTHRFFLCAAALGQSGEALDDPNLKHAALMMAREGLKRQEPDGTNPEKGGFDVNYQIVGVVFGERYLFVCEDPSVRDGLRHMIGMALQRERAAIDERGAVITEGTTRLTSEAARSGRAKTMDYKMLVQALVFWSEISGDESYRNLARLVVTSQHW
jgi:hypothetical protein